MDLPHLQILSVLTWALVGACLLPGTRRAFTRRRSTTDEWKSVVFFLCLLLVAFPSRWLFRPTDVASWKFLYVIGIAVGIYALILLWNGRRK